MATMGVVRARQRVRLSAEERREQLLAAATSLIAEHGYWALSMQDVADACDLSLTGLLHHFPFKDALLLAVLARHDEIEVRELDESLGVTHPAGVPPESPLVEWHGVDLWSALRATVERNARQPEFVRLYAILEAESLAPVHPAHEYFVGRQERTLALFRRLAGDGPDADLLARKVLALMDGLQLQWLRDPALDFVQTWLRVAEGIRTER